jgi:hypothetical protein
MTRNTGFWFKWTSPCETLPRLFSDSPNLHIMLLLGSPCLLLIAAARFLTNYNNETYAACLWEKPGQMRTMSSSCPLNRDVFEAPTHGGWPAFYALIGVTLLFGLIAYRNNPRRLMQVTFQLHFLITATIRLLSTFSGWTTQPSYSSLIWNSNSPGKICWLWLLVECGCWNWTYLGFYDDYYLHEGTRTVYDQSGHAVWTFTSKKKGDEVEDKYYFLYSPIFRPWRDIAVRLSYIHLIDNAIHVIWFRYLHVDAPYTTYINNSEILTVVLLVSLAVYTYTRMRVYFDDNVARLLVDIKTTVPLPIPSASRDLFTFASPHHLFRISSRNRQIFIIFTCIMTMFETAKSNSDSWVASCIPGMLFLCGPVAIISRELGESWDEYQQM